MNTKVTKFNDQVGEMRVLSWNINGLGNKMADPDLLEFIREYDIFLTETMKGNDYTLVLPGYQFYHVSRSFKHKNEHLIWLTVTTEYYQKNIKIGCVYIPPENSYLCWSKK